MSNTSPSPSPSPSVLIYSTFTEGPRGIRKHMETAHPDVHKLCTYVPFHDPLTDESLESFRKAEVMLMDTDKLPQLMQTVENLKWLQSTWAGVDSFIDYVDPSLLPPKFTLSRFAGIFGTHMAEYVLGYILAHERRFAYLQEAQKRREWVLDEYTVESYRLLKGRTLSVVGAGDIGTEIGRVCKALNMRVIGLVRKELPKEQRSSAFDEFRTTKDLPYVLAEADFIVNVLPSTEHTIDFFSGETLSHCKKKPVFINVGRGNAISEESLIKAIREGWISHAILDVTKPEPLPKESPLWAMPEVTITPHVSSQSHGPEVAEVFMDNYRRYIQGQPLKHLLDWEAKY